MDYRALAAQLMRALRGSRSQTAFSRRLGYASNIAYPWESGRRSPTASEALRAAARTGVDVRAAVASFFQRQLPEELAHEDPTSPVFVAALLRAARGKIPMRLLAERLGQSRSAVSRILSGATEPRLPVFLHLVDASSRRLLDLLAGFVDVASLPAARAAWQKLEALRRLTYDNPLTEAVPRFLELEQYAALPRHEPGWIASRLGISLEDEQRTLEDLATAGLVHFDGKRWQLEKGRSVDTSRDPRGAARLAHHWTRLASERIASGADGRFSYLVFGTDDETLEAIYELRLRYVRELRTLVRKARVATRVIVANAHLFPIDGAGA
ncbi:MAG: DUF4423 domain-containing protein [Myxococcales bacterium]|nr:DUF4423 domain-containing protein [Myxococcales bacterium]